MIKQLLPTGNAKEAQAGASGSEKAGESEAAAKQGLFGSILESVQSFGKKFEKDASSGTNQEQAFNKNESGEEALVASAQEPSIRQHGEPEQTVLRLTVQKTENVIDEGTAVQNAPGHESQNEDGEAVGNSLQLVQQEEGETEEKNLGLNLNALKDTDLETAAADEQKAASPYGNLTVADVEEANMQSESELKVNPNGESTKANISVKETVLGAEAEKSGQENAKVHDAISSPQTNTKIDGEHAEEGNRILGQASTATNRPFLEGGDESVEEKMTPAQQLSKDRAKTEGKSAEKVPTENLVGKSGSPQQIKEPAELHKGVYAQKVEEKTEKKFKERYGSEGRLKVAEERLSPLETSSNRSAEESAFKKFDVMGDFPKAYQSNASGNVSDAQEWMLKKLSKEQIEVPESKEQLAINMARLTEIPVANTMLRREIMPRMVQAMQKSVSAGKAANQSWQKHNFELDDGNHVRLSTRQMEGVLQVKIGSSNVELTRLMQQYEQEIKQYLEQKCELNVDLQFTGNEQGQEMSNFFGESGSSQSSDGMRRMGNAASKKASAQPAKNMNNEAVRKFGYNQMEWTA